MRKTKQEKILEAVKEGIITDEVSLAVFKLVDKAKEETESEIDEVKATVEAVDKKILDIKALEEEIKAGITDERLLAIIKPLIPEVKDGKTPSEKELLALIKPLIPAVKDGKSPTIDELLSLIKPLITPAEEIAHKASKLAQEELKPLIPTIEQIEADLPKLGEPIRDSLELLKDENRLDISAIKGLDDYDEVSRMAREPKEIIKKYLGTGGGAKSLQEVTDIGATTTNKITVPAVQFNTSTTPLASAPGLIQWNAADGTYDMGLLNSSVLQVGQETMFYGKASGAIANGDVCQFAGVQGNHILIKKAVGSEIEANPHYLVGVATENIANNNYGYVTWFGKVNGVYTKTPSNQDTADWVAGDILYFNLATGQMTKTFPSVPNRVIRIAACIKEATGSAENGIIIVRPTFGSKLQDQDDVNGTPLTADGQLPVWNNTGGYFDFDVNIFDTSRTKSITYNVDGTVNVITDAKGTKTMAYNVDGTLASITGTGVYKSKTFTYSSGVLTDITVI